MIQFNLLAWYWAPAGHGTNVFSSAGAAYVANTDAGYLAWVAEGNTANTAITDGDLAFVLAQANLNAAALAVDPGDLSTLTRVNAALTAFAAGCALTSTGTPDLDGTYELTGVYWNYLEDLWSYANENAAFPNAAGTWVFPARSGNVTFDSVAELQAVVRGLQDYRFAWLDWVRAGGAAPAWGTKTIA